MILASRAESTENAANIIHSGGVIAFRTDTFYGLGVDPFNATAVRRIKELKGREENKPILLLISDRDQVDRFLLEQTDLFKQLAERFWPGPITLIGKARPELADGLTAGSGTIGLRLPDDEGVRALVRACGGALTATSANTSAQPSARNAKEVENYFGEGVDLIIDGGEVTVTKASTVLDLSGKKPLVVREGAITSEMLQKSGFLP
jgi:L-threonylcarbamoyladenylate synthase